MSEHVAKSPPGLAILAARLRQGLGWPGMVGVTLLIGAGLSVLRTGPEVTELRAQAKAAQSRATPVVAAAASAPVLEPSDGAPVNGATPGELSRLLAELQAVVLDYGLAWPGAELAMQVGTPITAARLDVRLVLRGSYLRVRQVLIRLGAQVPGLTIRELAVSRASSDAGEVEAKVVLGVFLSGDRASVPRSAAP